MNARQCDSWIEVLEMPNNCKQDPKTRDSATSQG